MKRKDDRLVRREQGIEVLVGQSVRMLIGRLQLHGYPWLIHRLTYRRTNHKNLHVRGYKEEGTTSTPFDMVVMNDLDRFHLFADVIDRIPLHGSRADYAKQALRDKRFEHKQYIAKYGEDMPEIRNWRWSGTG